MGISEVHPNNYVFSEGPLKHLKDKNNEESP